MNPGRMAALALATVAFAVNFWAWGLIAPLAPVYKELLDLSPVSVAIMTAVPVIVGSLGRIPLGALTDRYGGRVMFAAVSFAGVVPVLFLAWAADYWALIAGGLVLGLTGASFAVGIPYVNAWFPPGHRGLALGVFGTGNIGTAVAGFTAPWLVSTWGRPVPYIVLAVALAAVGTLFLVAGREPPDRVPAAGPFMSRIKEALAMRPTRELAALYARDGPGVPGHRRLRHRADAPVRRGTGRSRLHGLRVAAADGRHGRETASRGADRS